MFREPISIAAVAVCLSSLPAAAQFCLIAGDLESCEGSECETDFASTSDTGVGATSSVDLSARRARARAAGGVGERAATAFVGVRFIPAQDVDADFRINGSFHGVLQGGLAAFGRVTIWGGLRNVTTGETENQEELFTATESDSVVTNIPQDPLQGLVHEFSASLEAGEEYAIYFRVEARSQGAFSQSDFRAGTRGVYFDRLDITLDLDDSDGDGLFDIWETDGIVGCGEGSPVILPLHMMGADPDHKDIFVEYDWIPGSEPVASSITAVKDAFDEAPPDAGGTMNPDLEDGINIWIDTGNAATGDDLGGGGAIDLDDVPNGVSISKLGGDADGNGDADFYEIKDAYFDENRRYAFHYVIGGPNGTQEFDSAPGSCNDGDDNDGDGLVDGDDVGDCFRNSQAEVGGNDFFLNVLGSGIFMHELGHNLNLRHGGFENRNCKPNYISVMNYNMQNGIPQDNIAGQDTNADGMPDNVIIDYSPPRFPGGRGVVPTIELDEIFEDNLNGSGLDETVPIDPTDPENMTAFTDATGAVQTAVLDGPIDWSGDDAPLGNTPDDVGVTADINGGPASGCANSMLDTDPHVSHDDWSAIVLNFRQFGDAEDGPINPTEIPEPTPEELEDLLEAIYTTDLAITKTVDPNPWVAGQEVEIAITVENVGPNHTQSVRVTDALPDLLSPVSLPDDCAADFANVVTCDLGRIRAGETAAVLFRVRIDRELPCEDGAQFVNISNTASVENVAGGDPNPRNDNSTVRMQALCVNFEYPAKLICGAQEAPEVLRLLSGRYGTTINIHNPNDTEAAFFKKLALAFPPAEQRPGDVIPLAVDRLRYDQSLKSDCDELRDRLFDGTFPDGYIEGHVIVQSALSLDVQGVYTAAPLDGGVATIDVEYVPERDVRPEVEPLPDLVIVEELDLSTTCTGTPTSQLCQFNVAFGVQNIGDAVSGPFDVEVTVEPNFATLVDVDEELAPGEIANRSVIGQVIFQPADDAPEICFRADEPADAVEESVETNNARCLSLF